MFEAQFIKKLSNTKAEMKKNIVYKKKFNQLGIYQPSCVSLLAPWQNNLSNQRHIQNSVKHLTWCVLQK